MISIDTRGLIVVLTESFLAPPPFFTKWLQGEKTMRRTVRPVTTGSSNRNASDRSNTSFSSNRLVSERTNSVNLTRSTGSVRLLCTVNNHQKFYLWVRLTKSNSLTVRLALLRATSGHCLRSAMGALALRAQPLLTRGSVRLSI